MTEKAPVAFLILLSLLAFFYTAATGSVVTVEALYVKHNLRGSFLELGFIFSLAALVYALLAPILGMLADKYGKAKFLTIKLLFLAALAFSATLMTSAYQYLPVKVFLTLLSPLTFPLVNAMLVDLVGGKKHEGRLFSLFYISPALGGSFGSFSAGRLGHSLGLESAFIFSALLFFSAAVLAALLIGGDKEGTQEKREISFNPFSSFKKILKTPQLAILLLLSSVAGAHWITRDIVYPFFLEDVGRTVASLGLVFSSMGLAAAAVMLVGGELTDRLGPRKALWVAFALMGVSALIVPATSLFFVFWAFNLFFAAGEALVPPARLKVIAGLTEKGSRAEITSAMSSFGAVLGVIWPLLLGAMMETSFLTTRGIILAVGFLVAFGAIIGLTLWRRLSP